MVGIYAKRRKPEREKEQQTCFLTDPGALIKGLSQRAFTTFTGW